MGTSVQGSEVVAIRDDVVLTVSGAPAVPLLRPTERVALAKLLALLRDPACRERLRAESVPQPALDWLGSTVTDLMEGGTLPLGVSHLHARYLIGISAAVFDHLDAWGHQDRGLRVPIDAIGRTWLRGIEDVEEVRLRIERVTPLRGLR